MVGKFAVAGEVDVPFTPGVHLEIVFLQHHAERHHAEFFQFLFRVPLAEIAHPAATM